MSRNRQRRKERQAAANEPPREAGGVAVELREEADQGITAADVSMPVEEREEFDRGLTEQMAEDERRRGEQEDREIEAAELIEALGVLRESRANPLTAGIQVFTAMLEQARAGYAADRLAELEAAMTLDFNALEAQGIVQIAMANMDETGVPDVEHGIQLCIQARLEVAEDHGDESQVDGATGDLHRARHETAEAEAAEAEARREDAAADQEKDPEQEEIEREEAEADKPGPED